MTFPAMLFGFLLASFYGALFHFYRGGGIGRLFYYLTLSWVGFSVGHFLAAQLGWVFISVGPLHLGMATLGSFLFLIAGYWLSLVPERLA